MGEETISTPEAASPVEVRFGDIVQTYTSHGAPSDTGVVTGLSEHSLHVDTPSKDKEGRDLMGISGTCDGPVKVIGWWGDLEKIVEAHKVGFEKFNIPEEQWPELLQDLRTAADMGTVMYVPVKAPPE